MAHHTQQIPDAPNDIRPLMIGAKIPQLTLKRADGSSYDVSAAISERPTVLIFYRGGW